MPFDAVFMRAVLGEMRSQLIGGRVDKIYQPARDEIIIQVRSSTGVKKVLFSANPGHPRVQLTTVFRDNPMNPPMFCMLLRKYLSGGRIVSVHQPDLERVVDVEFDVLNELGDHCSCHLILEALGRKSNLIITNNDGRIVDCLRRVDAEMSEERQVLPGMFYHLPPSQNKYNPLEVDFEQIRSLVARFDHNAKIVNVLLDCFMGLSPLVCREVAYELTGDVDGLISDLDDEECLSICLNKLFESILHDNYVPVTLLLDSKPKDYCYFGINQYGNLYRQREENSFSELLDLFYAERERLERIQSRGSELIKNVTNLRNRVLRKLEIQKKELAEAEDRDQLRVNGELITANLYQMKKGLSSIAVQNYYDPNCSMVTISLDPLLTPQQNAAMYFKRYNKAKTAERILTQQIVLGESDLDYLESVLVCIRCAEEERDLIDIRNELEEHGFLRAKKTGKKEIKRKKAQPLEFLSTGGMRISVGRNNVQNDLLTMKLAAKSDYWFHVQSAHGAHVILWSEGKEPDLKSMTEAAQLAAWFSQSKDGSNVPVDYTPVKYVKKPTGSKPGKVIYSTYSTTYVTPEKDIADSLRLK